MHQEIRDNGWRQCRLFSEADSESIVNDVLDVTYQAGARLVLVSHDCDIVHQGNHEPRVEVCLAAVVEPPGNPNFYYGKNARRLHLKVEIDAVGPLVLELKAHERYSISRDTLTNYTPDGDAELAEREVTTIKNWLASRFVRAALPDEFNERIRPAWARISTIAKRCRESMSAIYISLDPRVEVETDADYNLAVYGCMTRDDWDNPDLRQTVEEAISDIATVLNGCDGIILQDSGVRAESQITLEDIRKYLIRWDFDHLSHRDTPVGTLPAG
ncbi:hypothetical protein N9985_02920 [Gammaproteobacteria bacterium]|nr:hypothetical protein [Gammaproteobacteria bacterium]